MARPDHPGRTPGNGVDQFEIELIAATGEAHQPIDGTKASHCRLSWRIALAQADALDGEFRVRVFAEAIGASFSCAIGEAHAAATPGRPDYELGILVPPGTLPGSHDNPDHPGLYRVTGVLQYQDRAGHSLGDIGATAVRQVVVR